MPSAFTISSYMRFTIGCGVPLMAQTPYQVDTSQDGTPISAAVGMLGNSGERLSVATASPRSLPALICCADVPMPSNIMSVLPASRSCMAGPAPR